MPEIYFNFSPGTHSNGRSGTRTVRNLTAWRRALNGHTSAAHGKEGNTVEGCPACRDLQKRIQKAEGAQ